MVQVVAVGAAVAAAMAAAVDLDLLDLQPEMEKEPGRWAAGSCLLLLARVAVPVVVVAAVKAKEPEIAFAAQAAVSGAQQASLKHWTIPLPAKRTGELPLPTLVLGLLEHLGTAPCENLQLVLGLDEEVAD